MKTYIVLRPYAHLTVARTIPAPTDKVVEAYTAHEKALSGCRRSLLQGVTRHGGAEKNGLGAVRELDCGAIWLEEEIIGFDLPHRMEYRITNSRASASHEFGRG